VPIAYDKEEIFKTYKKECEKVGQILGVGEIKENDNLPSYNYIRDNIGGIKKLRKKLGYEKKLSREYRDFYTEEDFKTDYGLPRFCQECMHLSDCPYSRDLSKCEYAKEVG
jgi:hypothetical protein